LLIAAGVAMVIASARFGSVAEAAKIAPAIAVIIRYARIVVFLELFRFRVAPLGRAAGKITAT
jgi:hypothetical protein